MNSVLFNVTMTEKKTTKKATATAKVAEPKKAAVKKPAAKKVAEVVVNAENIGFQDLHHTRKLPYLHKNPPLHHAKILLHHGRNQSPPQC